MSLHVENQHHFLLPVPADTAFMFFTAAGEEHWAPGWRPAYRWPTTGETRRGMVFTTGEGDEFTIWQMSEFDPARRRSRYGRTTPASRTGFVDIQVDPTAPEQCRVTVGYQLTALSSHGEAAVHEYEGARFETMIDGWREQIMEALPRLLSARIR